jgi:hypothetical protein
MSGRKDTIRALEALLMMTCILEYNFDHQLENINSDGRWNVK